MSGQLVLVSKAGDWKTIDQRELSARRARKTQRRGQAAVTTGALLGAGAYATGSRGNLGNWHGNQAVRQAGEINGGRKLLMSQEAKSIPKMIRLKEAGKFLGHRPLGSALIGGGTLAALGGAGMIQGAAREGYHQSRINSRRKDNAKRAVGKRAPMDHESSGYARYGDYSGKGKRLPDEFSKRDVNAKRDREVKHGQRVKTFSGRKATIVRQDHSGAHKFGQWIGQAQDVMNGTRGTFSPVTQREAHAKTDKWWNNSGIRATGTDDKRATKLMLRDRSNTARNFQRGAQGALGAGLGVGAASILAAGRGRYLSLGHGLAGAGVGGIGAQVFRPADRKLQFERPVSKRIRNKDAEDDRQRRLGAGVAATGLGSALLLRRGVGGAIETTRGIRQGKVSNFASLDSAAKDFFRHSSGKQGGKIANRSALGLRVGDAGNIAGGAALGGASLGLGHYARSRRNHRWE